MKRPIEFRGKRYKHGASGDDWVYGDYYHSTDGRACIDQWVVKEKTVGQYTGLKDKNDVKIFEGDILRGKVAVVDQDDPLITHTLGVIVWYSANCEFLLNDVDEYVRRNFDEPAYVIDDRQGWTALEIVGNIYDTPELLKQA